jgi:hypothetical protein
MRNVVFWDVTTCGSCKKNRRFGGTYRTPILPARKGQGPATLQMDATCSSETPVTLTRVDSYG